MSGARRVPALPGDAGRGPVGSPYGRVVPGTKMLEIDEAEMVFVTLARELRASGLTLRAIAAELDARSYHSRNGMHGRPHQIARMVASTTEPRVDVLMAGIERQVDRMLVVDWRTSTPTSAG